MLSLFCEHSLVTFIRLKKKNKSPLLIVNPLFHTNSNRNCKIHDGHLDESAEPLKTVRK